ncbi:MAG: class II fructose-bisphosphate aldolase [Eubacteriales bacterium]|nr:class II fructose-bisphosphate aldolase [Eubacteriales bacterium]
MAYANCLQILKDAQAKGYGVPMFNVLDYESAAWVIEVAGEEGMPVEVGFFHGFAPSFDPIAAALTVKEMASRVKAPIGLHLDHTPDYKTIAPFLKNWDSVMIDGSSLPYEENLALTKSVVEICHPMGVSVEAELGHVGSGASLDDIQNPDHYTDPKKAAEFVAATGCDSLAIAIGNAHGQYVAAPNLDFGRLAEVRAAVDVPLVLHGGSGIPDEQFSKCAAMGMSKFNVFTDLNMGYVEAVKKAIAAGADKRGMLGVMLAAKEETKEVIRHKMRILNPNDLHLYR